jgi:hypothetical protein
MPKSRPGLFLALALLCAACNSGSPHSTSTAATPTFTTFDALENPLASLPLNGSPAIVSTIPTDINASGYIVGYGSYGLADSIGFLRTPDGTINSLPSPVSGGSQGTQCFDINAAGAAVCFENSGIVKLSGSGVPIFSQGSLIWSVSGKVNQVLISGNNVFAFAINDGGDVAGMYAPLTGPAVQYGFLLTSGDLLTPFDIPNAATLTVSRVSNSDQIIGTFRDNIGAIHGFLRSADGTLTQIDAPNTGSESNYCTTLNDMNGTIVGSASNSSGMHSFSLTSDGSFTVFDPSGTGSAGSAASGINSPAPSSERSPTPIP